MVALWPHQQAVLKALGPKTFLYAGMSSGKTLIALTWLSQMRGLRLVVTPKAAMSVYVEDNRKHFEPLLNVVMLNSGTSARKAARLEQIAGHNDAIVVVNYETARLLPLGDYNWKAVVLDECHRIGTRNSAVTLALTRMLENVPNKLAMTGTPYHDGYERLYAIFRFLDGYQPGNPSAHPISRHFGKWDDFLNAFCIYHTPPNKGYVRIITGYKNTERLVEIIKPQTITVWTEDVIDLPDLVVTRVPVHLSDEAEEYYDAMAREGVIKIDDDFVFANGTLPQLLRLSQITNNGQVVNSAGEVMATADASPRVEALESLLEQLGGKPAVVFTRFVADQKLVAKAVRRVTKTTPCYLNGQTDDTVAWRQGKGQVLIANIASGSVGLRLERAAHIIFWSLGFSHSQYAQAVARCRREGQKASTVFTYEMVAGGTVDERVYEVLHGKRERTEALDASLYPTGRQGLFKTK